MNELNEIKVEISVSDLSKLESYARYYFYLLKEKEELLNKIKELENKEKGF